LASKAPTPSANASARTWRAAQSSSRYAQAIGLSKAEAIRAATVYAAKAVGMASDVGVLRKGALADVIAVRGHPLDDLHALQNVTFVMKGGVVVTTTSQNPKP
jgi:imidazolonepropionase-like amidohydrolase